MSVPHSRLETDAGRFLPALVARHARQTPDAPALVAGRRRYSYAELDSAANRLAHRLRGLGAGAGEIVGICLERSADAVIALLAVLKSGAGYVMLDPAYPRERLAHMALIARPRVVVTRGELAAGLRDAAPRVLCLDRDARDLARQADRAPAQLLAPGDTCYLMFTSGSTGVPKGVRVSHGNLAGLFAGLTSALSLRADDRWTWSHSGAFGFSVWEIWGAWLHGACLVVVPDSVRADPAELSRLLLAERITIFSQTPTGLRRLLAEPAAAAALRAGAQRWVALSGEPVRADDLQAWFGEGPDRPGLMSTYAATETSGQVTLRIYAREEAPVPAAADLGRPLPGREVLVVDDELRPVPAGEAGEICVGGNCVAGGYLRDPELTAERFVRIGGLEAYRTGDRGRVLPDGGLEYLGRRDTQVKFRGYRLEPGEIEAALRDHPAVQDAAVTVRDDGTGAPRLVACVVRPGTRSAGEAGELEFWPSLGGYQVYDEFLYNLMSAESGRVAAYRRAFEASAAGRVVLDLGTGRDALLARLAAEAGARRVYGVELLSEAAEQAREVVRGLGLEDRIEIIAGDAATVSVPEAAELCTQGIIGNIGSADGIVPIWNASRTLRAAGCTPVPRRCTTRVAAVELPETARPRIAPLARPYLQRIFDAAGGAFDIRLCVRNLPPECVLSSAALFEDLDFSGVLAEAERGEARLRVTRAGRLDGLLLWTVVDTGAGTVDYLSTQQGWLPVYFPLVDGGLEVDAGDEVGLSWERFCESDARCPDYHVSAVVHARGRAHGPFTHVSRHVESGCARTGVHAALLADFAAEPPAATVESLREWLGGRLPEHMIPTHWLFLPALPVNPSGKLDRGALPAPGRERPELAVAYCAPRNRLEEDLARLWSDVLGLDGIGVDDNFFDLGGDSITAVQLTTGLQRLFNDTIMLVAVFDAPTVAGLAGYLQREHAAAVTRRYHGEPPAARAWEEGTASREYGEV